MPGRCCARPASLAEFYTRTTLGETRHALVADGQLLEMHMRRAGDGPPAGTRLKARLHRKQGARGFATADGAELLVEPWPRGLREGDSCILEIRRAAWPERGRPRLAKARASTRPAAPAAGTDAQLQARGATLRRGWPDWLEEAWADNFTAAELGLVPIAGGSLQLTPTPALVAIDVDGAAVDPGVALAAVARLIARWQLGGNIVVDLPDAGSASARQHAAAAFDAAMQHWAPAIRVERTAINGFGLMQIVCPRPGPSVLERAWFDRAGTRAIDALQQIARSPATGPIRLALDARARHWLEQRPQLLHQLAAATRRPLDAEPFAAT